MILKARKKPLRKQDECFRDLLGIFDRDAKDLYGNTLSTYASRFKSCEAQMETDYIKLTDKIVLDAFEDRIKDDYCSVLEEVREFASKSIDMETKGKWLVQAILTLIEADEERNDNAKFYILPNHIPVYKSELCEIKMVYFYHFLLGIWHYICSKPLEMELHDKDGVVTFLSLNILEKYI